MAAKISAQKVQKTAGSMRLENTSKTRPTERTSTPGQRTNQHPQAAARPTKKAAPRGTKSYASKATTHAETIPSPSKAAPPIGATQAPVQICGSHAPQTKKNMLIGFLQHPEGVTIQELGEKMQWLPHTVRASLSGLRKTGHNIIRQARSGQASAVYRLDR